MDKKNSFQKKTFKKVLLRIKPYMPLVILSLAMAAVTVALTLYFPLLTGDAIDYILEPGNVDFGSIKAILIKMVCIVGITALCQWIMNILNNHITYDVTKDIRDEAFKKIEMLPLKYIDNNSAGDLVSRVIADVDQFADGLLMGFTQLFTGVLTIVGTLFFMFRENITISLVVLLVTPISLFVAAFIAKRTYSMFRLQSETRGEETSFIDEMIANQKVVQAFGQEEKNINKFDEINRRLGDASMKATFFSSITNPSTRFVNSLVYTSVGIVGAFSVIGGRLSVGQLSAFLSYANQYTKPFNEISGVVTELQNALACAARIFELIEEEPQSPDSENASVLDEADGNVVLRDVAFSYTPDKKFIENMNRIAKAGQRIAIVGPTGCGKTTLINLLMRFYETDGGEIEVSGHNIKNITRKSLRANYGMVLQDTWLKSGTIRENIVMGKPDATDEEVIAAAKASHADSFIRRLPNGYDTFITEDGGSLSQGQKQL